MNVAAPRLSPIFRSDTQAEILARFLLNPDRGYTVAELQRATGAPYATVHREVQRLVDAELLNQETVGRAIRMTANQENPAFAPLVELIRMSYGPAAVLPAVLADIPEIEEAYLYGSWAARRAGERGSPPGDIDVLVVGRPDRTAIHDAADSAERRLGRDVNIRVVAPDVWRRGDDLFVRTLKERPMAALDVGVRS